MIELGPFKQLVYDYSGLLLDGGIAEERLNQYLLQTQQLLGLSAAQLLKRLHLSRPELDTLISQLTVNETYFFREPEQISLFVRQLLPRLLELAGDRPVRILSAGCSSGEEPYSLAMAILEVHGEDTLQQVEIDAGDVDLGILGKARKALYTPFSFRGVRDEIREKYFTATGKGYQLNEHIRKNVRFFMLNLMTEKYPCDQGLYDIIFFRNVSIYFDLQTRQQIQQRFRNIMREDAALFLGTAETLGNDFGTFELCETRNLYYFAKGERLLPDRPKPQPAPEQRIVTRPLGVVEPVQPPAPLVEPVSTPIPDPQLIKQLLYEKRHTEAASKLDLLLNSGQHKLEARLMQAWLQLDTGNLATATTILDQILQLDNWNLDALLALGLCSKWQHDLEAASQLFKKACYAHADSWLAQYFYGDCLRHCELPESARGPLQIARRILSTNLEADTGCRWLPLAPPANDALFLIERHLLNLKPGRLVNTPVEP